MPLSLVVTNLKRAAEQALEDRGPVPGPLGELVSRIGLLPLVEDEEAARKIGIWECTPGRWPRQQKAAEFAVIVSGRCRFTPAGGAETEFGPGDVLYFPENTTGIWDVTETIRKVYLIAN
jgi:uncharacterized cupin superfamily protein